MEYSGSFHDFPHEPNYHTFMLGLLAALQETHTIVSNKEYGLGRPDKLLIPKNDKQPLGIILEYKAEKEEKSEHKRKKSKKKAANKQEREQEAKALLKLAKGGLEQINLQCYAAAFMASPHVTQVIKIAIAFKGKLVVAVYQATILATQQNSETKEISHVLTEVEVRPELTKRQKLAVEGKAEGSAASAAGSSHETRASAKASSNAGSMSNTFFDRVPSDSSEVEEVALSTAAKPVLKPSGRG